MFGLRFIKTGPADYLIHYRNGKIVREGAGLSFFYFAPSSTLARVPLSSTDVPFMFSEVSADFQSLSIQGQLSYRVKDAKQIAGFLDFSITPGVRHVSEDPEKLKDRLVSQAQVLASAVTHRLTLREALTGHELLNAELLAGLRASELVTMLGVEILGLSVLAIAPSPETSKALEAETREQVMRKADEAVYARRNAAVEQERRIKESELNTEIAVEEKKRQIRETRLAADIAVEQQRETLLDKKLENDRKEADARAYALDAMLKPVRDVDWRTLSAISAGRSDAKNNIAVAFRELAEKAERIGQLNITPDLLAGLLADRTEK
jgi:regulator of protease activity HflC (stomatin/prohibitin superfamily)